jgi:hypothetical protein
MQALDVQLHAFARQLALVDAAAFAAAATLFERQSAAVDAAAAELNALSAAGQAASSDRFRMCTDETQLSRCGFAGVRNRGPEAGVDSACS